MAFTKSTVATNNISALPNKPTISATALKAAFDKYGADDKPYINSLIDELEATTGTSGAENIGSKTIVGVTGNTPHAQITDVKTQLDARNAENVKLTENQTIAGIKTFLSSPIVPVASADTQAPQKKYVDDENLKDVHLTGNQTIAGVKTFSSSPNVPTPVVGTAATNKDYIDLIAASFTLGAIPDASLTYDKQNAESKLTVEKQSFKNKFINGDFDIWQRGISQITSGYGSDDRWTNQNSGSTKVHTQESFALGQTDVPNNPKYFSRTVVTSVAGAGNYCRKAQLIESVKTFSSEIVTLSFYAKADAVKNISVSFRQSFGTGGSPSAIVNFGATKIQLSTSLAKYTLTVAVPSVTGKTLGTNGDDYLAVYFYFDAGTSFDIVTDTLGQQSGTFDIAQVQIEQGSIATAFEQRPIEIELELCQRYYEKSYELATPPGTVTSTPNTYATFSVANATVKPMIFYKTEKRVTPNTVIYSYNTGASGNVYQSNGGTPSDIAVTQNWGGSKSIQINYTLTGNNTEASFHWAADAE